MPVTLKSRFPEIAAALPNRVGAALEPAAETIKEAARQRVPVATGRLRDAIHVRKDNVLAYSVVAGDDEAFYGHMVEHGTNKNPPHPFLVPAAEEQRDQVEHLVTVVLQGL